MLKIGEFSKLSMLTVKALRFYEREGLLVPAEVDKWTGYRYYETGQLSDAALLKALRQLDFSIDEIKAYRAGSSSLTAALTEKAEALKQKQADISAKLSVINFILEDKGMEYQAVIKQIPQTIVYSEERRLKEYGEVTSLVLESAEECRRLNPDVECTKPDYCFCEYLDGEYRETDMMVRYSQAVTKEGVSNERIRFRTLPATKALCIYHKGAYDRLGDAYAYLMEYAESNGYRPTDYPRECYIDGIWNKEDVADWLTEIQLPIA